MLAVVLACLSPGQYQEQKESVEAVTQVGGDQNRNPNATGRWRARQEMYKRMR